MMPAGLLRAGIVVSAGCVCRGGGKKQWRTSRVPTAQRRLPQRSREPIATVRNLPLVPSLARRDFAIDTVARVRGAGRERKKVRAVFAQIDLCGARSSLPVVGT